MDAENTEEEVRETLLAADEETKETNSARSMFHSGLFGFKPSTKIILPAMLLQIICMLALVPILPNLQVTWFEKCTILPVNKTIEAGFLRDVIPDGQRHCVKDVSNAQLWSGLFDSTQNFLAFLLAPQIGNLSDQFGRKPVMMLYSVFAWLPMLSLYVSDEKYAGMFYSVTILSGLFGISKQGGPSVYNIYVADCTTEEERTSKLSMIGSVLGLSLLGTPVLSGLLGYVGSETTYLLGIAFTGSLGSLYILLVVPESNPAAKPGKQLSSLKLANPFKPIALMRENKLLLVICCIVFLAGFPDAGTGQISVLFMNELYELSPSEATQFDSLVFSGMGVSSIVAQAFVVPSLLKSGLSNSALIVLSEIFNCIHLLWYGMLPLWPGKKNRWLFFVNCAFIGFIFVGMIALFSLLSKSIPKDQYGLSMGTLTSVQGLASIFGPLVFTQLYSTFHMGAKVFFVGAVFALASACVAWAFLPGYEARSKLREASR